MIIWETSGHLVEYPAALAAMEAHVDAMLVARANEKQVDEKIWLLQHPPLYTAGTSAVAAELTDKNRFPVFQTGRGGRYTYHGPGQRVAYVMLDLNKRGRDVRDYVCRLEAWVITALGELGVNAERREGRVGLWVAHKGREEKIAAIGVRLRRWISFHGVAINVNPDLSHFNGIVPCGLSAHDYGVTSLAALGISATMNDVDQALKSSWDKVF